MERIEAYETVFAMLVGFLMGFFYKFVSRWLRHRR